MFLQGLVALQFLQVFDGGAGSWGGRDCWHEEAPSPHCILPTVPVLPDPYRRALAHTTVAIFWLKNAISGWSQHQHQQQLHNTGKNLLQKTKKHLNKFGVWIKLVKKLTVSFSVNVCHIVIDCGKSFYHFVAKKIFVYVICMALLVHICMQIMVHVELISHYALGSAIFL